MIRLLNFRVEIRKCSNSESLTPRRVRNNRVGRNVVQENDSLSVSYQRNCASCSSLYVSVLRVIILTTCCLKQSPRCIPARFRIESPKIRFELAITSFSPNVLLSSAVVPPSSAISPVEGFRRTQGTQPELFSNTQRRTLALNYQTNSPLTINASTESSEETASTLGTRLFTVLFELVFSALEMLTLTSAL